MEFCSFPWLKSGKRNTRFKKVGEKTATAWVFLCGVCSDHREGFQQKIRQRGADCDQKEKTLFAEDDPKNTQEGDNQQEVKDLQKVIQNARILSRAFFIFR